ncbi:MAG: endolytic transglycosylase MltG [Rickettsiales bacterium]|nr:endolytic transglycosylase MltG [Rickettsiales bacterium]
MAGHEFSPDVIRADSSKIIKSFPEWIKNINMKKKSKILTSRLLVKAVVAVAALVIVFGVYVLGVQSPIRETVFYQVASGASISAVAADMKGKGLIACETLFKASVLLQGNRVQSGVYELQPGAGIYRISQKLNRGDIASVNVLIPEGLTVKQIKNLLMENDVLSGEVECAPATADSTAGGAASVCDLKEGDLFPDTYRVARGANRLAVLERAVKKMETIRLGWNNSGKPMPSPLKSWNEVITLASIVQKETPKVSEMPIVASVYLNRLKKKMKLQADPTVVYAITDGLGDMRGQALFTGHLKTQNPYNTYVNYGLPPAPIANVGRHALAAVLNPADTNYLFFVADGQGGHKFARSYEEHQKNHADWRVLKKSLNSKKDSGSSDKTQ